MGVVGYWVWVFECVVIICNVGGIVCVWLFGEVSVLFGWVGESS